MEALIALFALGVAGVLVAMPIVALVALTRANRALHELEQMRNRMEALGRPEAAARPRASAAEPVPSPRPPAPAMAPLPPLPPRPTVTAAAPRPANAIAPPGAALPQPAGGADFATSLGPKILVGAGGLAVVVFLGFFVRYAWENNWVGPTGRVLSAAVFSLGLLALGLRIIGRDYRPLGQGLAATGFAGLYITAFAAHAVYGLVPRSVAAAFMIAVTACAVLLAERLDARLLAGLAWVGGYLAPVLLSTGADRAVSLFAYLLLLGAGALWLDRRKPWPETTPIALVGTLLLYSAWYAAHFRPERFEVAAGGLVALTALFAAGTARKERPAVARGDAARGRARPVAAVDRRRPAGGAARPVARPRLRGAADRPRPRRDRRAGGGGGRGRALPRLGGHALPGGELRPRCGLGGRRRAAAGSRGTRRGSSRGPDARARRRGGRPRVGRPRRTHGPPGGAPRARRRPGPPGRGHRETVGLDDPDRSLAGRPGRLQLVRPLLPAGAWPRGPGVSA